MTADDQPTTINTGGGAYIEGPVNTDGGDFIGRDKITIFKGPAYPLPDYPGETAALIDFYTRAFVGREDLLALLARVGSNPNSGYLLLQAPAGYGKSALIAQLVHRWQVGKWGDGDVLPRLLFFFIRSEGRRNTPEAFLQAVNAQIIQWLKLKGGVPGDLGQLQAQFSELWSLALKKTGPQQPLLLLVDGLDEMLVEKDRPAIAELLPTRLRPYVHVVVSSRPNPDAAQRSAPQHPLRQAEMKELHTLTHLEIQQLLKSGGLLPAQAAGLAPKIFLITRGEPLFVRFVCEDAVEQGEAGIAKLESSPPADVEQYFERQFERLDDLAEGPVVQDILGLLGAALGGLSAEELADILKARPREVRKAVELIRRYLIGTERMELMHLQLAKIVRQEFPDDGRQAYTEKLLNWCLAYLESGWPDATPYYVVQHTARHLLNAGHAAELHALLQKETSEGRNAWFDLRERRGQIGGYLDDVNLAWEQARQARDEGRQIRYALIAASLNSLAANLNGQLLVTLVETDYWAAETALAYTAQVPDAGQRVSIYATLAPLLSPEQRARTMAEALAAVHTIESGPSRANLLAAIAPHLPLELLAEAMDTARTISLADRREQALAALIVNLPPGEALAEARTFTDEQSLFLALKDLVPRLPPELLEDALHAAQSLSDRNRLLFLSALAPRLLPDQRADALATAPHLEEPKDRLLVLLALAAYLRPEEQDQAYAAALASAREIKNFGQRAAELAYHARLLPPVLFSEALAAIRAKEDGFPTAGNLLEMLAPHLPPELFDDALEISRISNDKSSFTWALAALAPRLPVPLLRAVLPTAEGLEEKEDRARALTALAPHFPPDQKDRAVTAALEAALAIDIHEYRAPALTALVPHLPPGLKDRALAVAREAARGIVETYRRAQSLAALAPHFPPDQQRQIYTEALKAALSSNKSDRTSNLILLSASLPAEHKTQALTAALDEARAIRDQVLGDAALINLALVMPPEHGIPLLAVALNTAELIDAKNLCAILRLLQLASNGTAQIQARVLDTVLNRSFFAYTGSMAAYLAAIVPCLLPDMLAQIFNFMLENGFIFSVEYLLALAPSLPPERLIEALAGWESIADQASRAEFLGAIASYLPPEHASIALGHALDTVEAITDRHKRAQALNNLAPHLQPQHLERALDIVEALSIDPFSKLRLLAALAPNCPLEYHNRVLTALRKIEQEMADLAAIPDLSDMQMGLEVIRQAASKVLVSLAPRQPAGRRLELLSEALSLVLAIHFEELRAYALVEIVPHLPPDLLDQALAAARELLAWEPVPSRVPDPRLPPDKLSYIEWEHSPDRYRSEVLAACAPELPPREALSVAKKIMEAEFRARALAAIVPHLSPELLVEAMHAAQAIRAEAYRVAALAALAAGLPTAQKHLVLVAALDAARTLKDQEGECAQALIRLAPLLPGELLVDALKIALEIRPSPDRAKALSILAARLAELQAGRTVWPKALGVMARGTRRDLLSDLSALTPWLVSFGPETVPETIRAIQDVERWWP